MMPGRLPATSTHPPPLLPLKLLLRHVAMAAAGQHRAAGVVDLLTAAVAEYHRAVVLHYDADFEHIAAITGQAHKWIVPRGTIT